MASSTRPERFVIVETPYYTTDAHIGSRITLPRALGVPEVGDIVEANPDALGVDHEGDRPVVFNGNAFDIADAVLVSIDTLIKSPADRAEPLADWERELLNWDGAFHEVTLAQAVIRPTVLADLLKARGMSGETVEELTAIAVLRSVS